MKLTAKVKLQPTTEQHSSLLKTLTTANDACNYISGVAWDTRTFGKFQLQKLVYTEIRERFGLGAQLAIRCISKVTDAYKLDSETKRTFKPHGAVAYDDRILYWQTDNQVISIWTLTGRERMPYLVGDHQRQMLEYRSGESDLIYNKQKNCFYLLATCDIPDPEGEQVDAYLGVDLGEKNIATTSDGEIETSEVVESNRLKHARLRKKLQATGTKSARRKLNKLRGKQARFQKDVNHQISKRLVATAKRTQRGIAVEDLTGIRTRTRVKGKKQRAKRSNWSFAQLRMFLEYKARMAGIPMVAVDPAYTSQRCFVCGHIERANRKSQSEFLCCDCGYQAHADINAARNISRAALNQPFVSDAIEPAKARRTSRQGRSMVAPGTSPRASAVGS